MSQNNIDIFKNTIHLLENDCTLRRSLLCAEIANKNTFLYKHSPEAVPRSRTKTYATIESVTNESVIQCALRLSKKTAGRIAVLSFSNPGSPGGGVEDGAFTQEASICRLSDFYPRLLEKARLGVFYDKSVTTPYDDQVLYSRDVAIIKPDIPNPVLFEECERLRIDVACCAAPNQNEQELSYDELYEIIEKRISLVLDSCLENGATNVVLGAWGCGALKNPPQTMISAMMSAISEEYTWAFENLIFAVPDSGSSQINYNIFHEKVKYWYYP